MRHHRLSASGLSRGQRCLYWARPDIEVPEREPDEYTLYGAAWHAVVDETIATGKKCAPSDHADALDEAQIDRIEATYDTWWNWWQKAKGDLEWKSEIRIAWNVDTGAARFLPKTGEHREYGQLEPYEVPGTLDAYGIDADHLEVPDWKSGYKSVEAPATNLQLHFYGGALASALGRDSARVTVVKPSEDVVYVAEPADLDVFSFTLTRAAVRDMVDRIPGSNPNAGPWCSYCPMRGACPATIENVEQVIDAAAIVRKREVSLNIQDNDHAAWLLSAVDGVADFLKSVKSKVREYADKHGGILLEDGTVWSGQSVHTEKPDLDKPGALQALYTLGLTEAIESKTTWAAIKRVGGKEGERAARDRLKALGAIKASDHPRYEARPVKKGRAA